MTLTDFLLARITEDEAVAKSISLDPDGVARQRFGKPGRAQWLALAVDRPWRDGVSRALAEVVSKRRIVERHRWADAHQDYANDMEIAAQWSDAYETLCDLAAPYADHPHYDDEWAQ